MEKAILITVDLRDFNLWTKEERAKELRELALSSGADVVGEIICSREKPTPDLFIGKGKLEEIIAYIKDKPVDLVIFNNELTPTQLRNLEMSLPNARVLDRTQLILDIFAKHARSMEGKIQVELAQMEYLLPRLTGRGIMLSRLGGGIGTKGPGEKILEYDRRKIRHKISVLKRELKGLEKRRSALRARRRDKLVSTIAIIGYTNAGKTTLLNKLTSSSMLAKDQLFSTLDPVGRLYVLPNNLKVIFHDTVGFLNGLPHDLIESFKATLEEVRHADILVHVLDVSNPIVHKLDQAVYNVLKELKAEHKPIINALNKTDIVDNPNSLNRIKNEFNNPVLISALKGDGIEELIDKISFFLSDNMSQITLEIPSSRMDLVNLIYEKGKVSFREDRQGSVYIEGFFPSKLKSTLLKNSTLDMSAGDKQ